MSIEQLLAQIRKCAKHEDNPSQPWVDGQCLTPNEQLQALDALICRRDEEHVRHLITMIESDGVFTPELERLKRAIRAEFADTPKGEK